MNFHIPWYAIPLILWLFFCGCSQVKPYIPQKHCPLIYANQADLVRQLKAIRQAKIDEIRASMKEE